ncbi:hypothetical protein [Burkholderia pseudomallei]|nr:hypothetical protein [Burkholderia pseudomallei]CAJ2999877.1 Uncharacterised protein [Burkholderia pseudomallei]CAJ3021155.1 Uncharacterised protein [Burkholderia pseudomallei]CAJ3052276.1 Uncharacterised protein [Burkholderia pseudomallei]CAJ3081416.1 Uncharacterised protein [Burkholderia pseudomallei]CAJ3089580.1 Uncharacterised protein [Burkholderia pseudomallei]
MFDTTYADALRDYAAMLDAAKTVADLHGAIDALAAKLASRADTIADALQIAKFQLACGRRADVLDVSEMNQ